MGTRLWAGVAAGVLVVALTGCTSSSSPTGQPAATESTVPVPPSTVLDGTNAVTVPFTADDGALVVTAGPPPADVTQERAVARVQELRVTSTGDPPHIVGVVSGLVTLRPGLGPDSVVARSAWVVVYTQRLNAACPMRGTEPAIPSSASQLRAIIILGEQPLPTEDGSGTIAPVFGYNGAGTGLCIQSSQPGVASLDELIQGAY
jgi:hypothetical protein